MQVALKALLMFPAPQITYVGDSYSIHIHSRSTQNFKRTSQYGGGVVPIIMNRGDLRVHSATESDSISGGFSCQNDEIRILGFRSFFGSRNACRTPPCAYRVTDVTLVLQWHQVAHTPATHEFNVKVNET